MPTESTRSRLNDVRDAFTSLSTPDKALFLIEGSFSTLGEAIRDAAEQVSDVLESLDVDDASEKESAEEEKDNNSESEAEES